MLAAFILAATLAQAPPPDAPPPVEPEPTPAITAPAAADAPPSAAASVEATSAIDAGLAAFKRRRFSQARTAFERAVQAEPNSAPATFYLAYTIYKIAEKKRPFHPEKQQAAEMFAKAYELDPTFQPVWQKRK
jgi:tetratricopeptide (TPR) repeat protein